MKFCLLINSLHVLWQSPRGSCFLEIDSGTQWEQQRGINKQGSKTNLNFWCCPSMTLLYVYLNQAGIKFRVEKNHTFCRCPSTSCLYVYSDQTGIKLNVINSPHHHYFLYTLLCLRNMFYFAFRGKFKKLKFNSP